MNNYWTNKRTLEDFIVEVADLVSKILPISVEDALEVLHSEVKNSPLSDFEIGQIRTNKAALLAEISSEKTRKELKGLFLDDQDGLY